MKIQSIFLILLTSLSMFACGLLNNLDDPPSSGGIEIIKLGDTPNSDLTEYINQYELRFDRDSYDFLELRFRSIGGTDITSYPVATPLGLLREISKQRKAGNFGDLTLYGTIDIPETGETGIKVKYTVENFTHFRGNSNWKAYNNYGFYFNISGVRESDGSLIHPIETVVVTPWDFGGFGAVSGEVDINADTGPRNWISTWFEIEDHEMEDYEIED